MQMSVDAATCKRELVIEIPVEVVKRETESITSQFARVAKIAGFRPGKAPASLVRRRYWEDIRSEVVQSLLPRYFESAVKEQQLEPVGRPHFEELKFEEDQPLTCKAQFEVFPVIDVTDYRGLEVEQEVTPVREEDIEQALKKLQERVATFEDLAGRAAVDGDYVVVNYEGYEVGNPSAKPLEAHEATVHLGGESTVAEFSENLRGLAAGDTKEFDVSYPTAYPQATLAGKTYRYRVTMQAVKRKILPPIDDELARATSELETLDKLKSQIRHDLEKTQERRAENEAKQKLLDQLIARHPFPVPEVLVEAQLHKKLESIVIQLRARGIDPASSSIDWQRLQEEARPEAEKEVRGSLILEKVAEAEKLEVGEEEVDEVLRELASATRETAAALKTRLTRERGLDRIKFSRRNQKALEFIYRNAKIIANC